MKGSGHSRRPCTTGRAPAGIFHSAALAAAVVLASLAAAQEAAEEDRLPTGALEPGAPLEMLINPVFHPTQAEMVFRPLVDYLEEATGLEIRMVTARNFHRYWLDAQRGDNPPLVFEDAHMAAWRMENRGYTPLVTTRNRTTFSLLTTGAYADDELADFVGRQISSLPAPSLGYLVLADWFDNPMQQPVIQSNARSWMEAVEIIFAGEADAAVVPRHLVERFYNLYPVAESQEFPGLTLSAALDVPAEIRTALIDALTVLHENPDHFAALHELDIEAFEAADPDDYRGLERWLNAVFSF